MKTLARASLGLLVAAGALAAARAGAVLLGLGGVPSVAWAAALIFLLAWLLAPAPLGGRASWRCWPPIPGSPGRHCP